MRTRIEHGKSCSFDHIKNYGAIADKVEAQLERCYNLVSGAEEGAGIDFGVPSVEDGGSPELFNRKDLLGVISYSENHKPHLKTASGDTNVFTVSGKEVHTRFEPEAAILSKAPGTQVPDYKNGTVAEIGNNGSEVYVAKTVTDAAFNNLTSENSLFTGLTGSASVSDAPNKALVTKSVFTFKEDDFCYDRLIYLMNADRLGRSLMNNNDIVDYAEYVLGEDGVWTKEINHDDYHGHHDDVNEFYYPAEIIMTDIEDDTNFIHIVGVQDRDSHMLYFNGKPCNCMIVRDRTRWGELNGDGADFKKYKSVYTNNIPGFDPIIGYGGESYSSINKNTGRISKLQTNPFFVPVPSVEYGLELLNTKWNCTIVWSCHSMQDCSSMNLKDSNGDKVLVDTKDPLYKRGPKVFVPKANVSVCTANGASNMAELADVDGRVYGISDIDNMASVAVGRGPVTLDGSNPKPWKVPSTDMKGIPTNMGFLAHGDKIMYGPHFSEEREYLVADAAPSGAKLYYPNYYFAVGDKFVGFCTRITDSTQRLTHVSPRLQIFDKKFKLVTPITAGTEYPCNIPVNVDGRVIAIYQLQKENFVSANSDAEFIMYTSKGKYSVSVSLGGSCITAPLINYYTTMGEAAKVFRLSKTLAVIISSNMSVMYDNPVDYTRRELVATENSLYHFSNKVNPFIIMPFHIYEFKDTGTVIHPLTSLGNADYEGEYNDAPMSSISDNGTNMPYKNFVDCTGRFLLAENEDGERALITCSEDYVFYRPQTEIS